MTTEFEMYDLEIPTRIEVISSNGVECLYLQTTKISAKKIFFLTVKPLPENVQVSLDLFLHFTKPGKPSNAGIAVLINVTGMVIKSEQAGMTILLNEDYQITKLRVPAMFDRISSPGETGVDLSDCNITGQSISFNG